MSGGKHDTTMRELAPGSRRERLRVEMQRYETNMIVDALNRSGGNVTAAALALKIPVRTLTHKMQALGIKKRGDSG